VVRANRPQTAEFHDVLNKKAGPDAAEYHYPNQQSARMVWYHDHATGITRLNAYAGSASAYLIRDNFEATFETGACPTTSRTADGRSP
jgi:spore coat protein A